MLKWITYGIPLEGEVGGTGDKCMDGIKYLNNQGKCVDGWVAAFYPVLPML